MGFPENRSIPQHGQGPPQKKPRTTSALSFEELGVDVAATELVQALPKFVQQQLLGELKDGLQGGHVRNPSAWIVKAAAKQGATKQNAAKQGDQSPTAFEESLVALG